LSGALKRLVGKRSTRLSLILTIPAICVLIAPPWLATLFVVIALLTLVAEFDNQAGTFLPLAILFVIVLAILFILLGMMAFMHG
jgi:hypothetical protein